MGYFLFGGGVGGGELKVGVFEVFGSNVPPVVLIILASAKSFPSKVKP